MKHARSKSNLFLVGIMCFTQLPIHAWSKSNLFLVIFIYNLRVYTLAHSCLIKVQSIYGNRRTMFLTRSSSSKEALTTLIYYSILRNTRPTCLRASSRVCCYFWLMTSSAAGLFVPARATVLFSVSTRSMCVCDDWTPVYWFVVCYLLCLFMPGRVSRDMGLVWFLIPCFYRFCVFQPFWLILCGTDWD